MEKSSAASGRLIWLYYRFANEFLDKLSRRHGDFVEVTKILGRILGGWCVGCPWLEALLLPSNDLDSCRSDWKVAQLCAAWKSLDRMCYPYTALFRMIKIKNKSQQSAFLSTRLASIWLFYRNCKSGNHFLLPNNFGTVVERQMLRIGYFIGEVNLYWSLLLTVLTGILSQLAEGILFFFVQNTLMFRRVVCSSRLQFEQ